VRFSPSIKQAWRSGCLAGWDSVPATARRVQTLPGCRRRRDNVCGVRIPVTLGIVFMTLLAACASDAGETNPTVESLTRKPVSTNSNIERVVTSAIEQTRYTLN
jgi:hypothetical protein